MIVNLNDENQKKIFTVFPRTSKLVTDGAKLSTILCNKLEIKRITALSNRKLSLFSICFNRFTNVVKSMLLSKVVANDFLHDNSL